MTALALRPVGANGVPPTTDEQRDSAPSRSWSQYTVYCDCPKRWQLSKVVHVPRRPGVWLSAGTAVHGSIARYLTEQTVDIHWRSFDYES